MAINKKYICGVGKTYNYDSNDNLLWVGKTLIDSAIEVTTGSEEVRSGQGNGLDMIYYHSAAMSISQTDQQFNLTAIAKSIGSSIVTGANVWVEENVSLTASAGSVLGTPIAPTTGGAIYGWAELSDGTSERFTFSTKNFTLSGQSSGTVCVRYYEANAAARQITVYSNIIPSVVKTVIEAQMFSGDPSSVSTSTLIGKALVEVPRNQLDGTANLSLSTTGVSNTPIKGMALKNNVAGCSSSGYYATITEVIDTANWYDHVIALALVDDTPALTHPATSAPLVVWAVPNNGDAPFIAPNADLDFSSGTAGTAMIGAHTGIITTVANGSSVLTIAITAKTSVSTTATLTVS